MIQKHIIKLIIVLLVFILQLVICLINDDILNSHGDNLNHSSNSSLVIESNTNNETDHVCYREESYIEQVRIPVKQPVRVRLSNWCLEFPPRCSNYKTEIREVIQVQNISRTRIVEFCCEGYAEITAGNETICKPICRGGCGKGFCQAPNECICDVGYTGRHCTQRCRHGQWGEKCERMCKCRNDSICDSVTGTCQCQDGWTGELCDRPCTNGFYGFMCRNACECSSNRCNPRTGECILEEMVTKLKPIERTLMSQRYATKMTETTTTTTTTRTHEITTARSLDNETDRPLLDTANATNLIIETLNSTLANLTENIANLTKNLSKNPEPVRLIVPETILEITTMPPKPVIVIKPIDSSNPAVIIHSPTSGDANTGEILPILPITKSHEVIHVIANLQHPSKDKNLSEALLEMNPQHNHYDWSGIVSMILIFIVLIILSAIGFVIIYRQHLKNQADINSMTTSQQNEINQESKICTKPLPDLPAFTQNLKKTGIPEFYDRPLNNSIVPRPSHPYNYATANGLIYSETSKSYARKHSLEHLYDEIKYPTVHSTTSRL